MKVEMVWATPEAEQVILRCARVSSPHPESKDTRLLSYLVRHQHWSPFEMASMCLDIQTSRAISRQILRHRSFSFQEFSQRYAHVVDFESIEPRQASPFGNRQGSVEGLTREQAEWWVLEAVPVCNALHDVYQDGLRKGLARESIRFLLPEMTMTRLYMVGTFRSWMHYVRLRLGPDTQAEHREIARAAEVILCQVIPVSWEAMNLLDSPVEA